MSQYISKEQMEVLEKELKELENNLDESLSDIYVEMQFKEILDVDDLAKNIREVIRRTEIFNKTGKTVEELEDEVLKAQEKLKFIQNNRVSPPNFNLEFNFNSPIWDLEQELKNEKNPMRKKQLAREISQMKIRNKMMKG